MQDMVSKILLLASIGVLMYLITFINARFSRRTRTYLGPIFIIEAAGLLGALFLLLGGIHAFEVVGAFVIGICATLLIVVLEVRKARRAKQQRQSQEQRTMPPQ